MPKNNDKYYGAAALLGIVLAFVIGALSSALQGCATVAQADELARQTQGRMISATTTGTTYEFTGGATMGLFFRNESSSADRVCIGMNVDADDVPCTGADSDFDDGHIVLEPGEQFRAVNYSNGRVGVVAKSTARCWVLASKKY